MNDFHNRLKKRARHLRKWARRWPTEAFRVYDRDIPEYRWTVDVYGEHAFAQEFPRRGEPERERRERRQHVLGAITDVLDVPAARIHERTRERKAGGTQYGRQSDAQREITVREGELSFLVNLTDYIDTGLFLDHRELRRELAQRVRQRGGGRALNLFCYTGAFSVWAAAAGAHTTSVDLSRRYLDWAERNFELNGLDPNAHVFLRKDVLDWLPHEVNLGRRYEFIVLDPPTFSRSKRMERNLDIQRDHLEMVRHCLSLLTHDGVLFFSTNFRKFDPQLDTLGVPVTEISDRTVPEDFRPGIHRAWELLATP